MDFSLIICTYQRPDDILSLLDSVRYQTKYPYQIIVVDGSWDNETELILKNNYFPALEYFHVNKEGRGLTRQRNFGVDKVKKNIEVVFFLDDDIILQTNYFDKILNVYKNNRTVLGVSGYIINEVDWRKVPHGYEPVNDEFFYDGWIRQIGSRFRLRKLFKLEPNVPPGFMPDFSHGYSTAFLPPSGKVYEVEMLMGGIASYKKEIFNIIKFSTFFDGYGLYEDADFSLRVSIMGKLIVHTGARVEHYHSSSGRPSKFKYGKMVVRNGWYVWRIKFPAPSVKAKAKWHATILLLLLVRFGNCITTNRKREAFSESLGRMYGWIQLIYRTPKIEETK